MRVGVVRSVPLAVVRSSTLGSWLDTQQRTAPRGVLVADAVTESDLARLATALAARPHLLPAGSGGLARWMARWWCPGPWLSAAPSVLPRVHRVMVVVGSLHPQSHAQFAYLTRQPGVVSGTWPEIRRVASASTARARIVAVRLPPERGDPVQAAAALGEVAAWLRTVRAQWGHHVLGLVATGGDTVRAVLTQWGIESVWPQGEWEPGVPWSLWQDAQGTGVLVSKAGILGRVSLMADVVSAWRPFESEMSQV